MAKVTIEVAFEAPCPIPDGLQGSRRGLWLVDQIDDDVYFVDSEGGVLDRLTTESGNTSGITFGGVALWLELNGGPNHRRARPWDRYGTWVLKVSPKTGKTLRAFELPGEGGVHGLEWVRGKVWITRPGIRRMVLAGPIDRSTARSFEVSRPRLHGLTWDGDGIWGSHTTDRVIIKYDIGTGLEMDIIEVPEPHPAPHGLTLWRGTLWYCDADTGQVCKIHR